MFQYKKLQNKITKLNPKAITVDVFDTLLLRKNGSEPWRFWQISKYAVGLLKTHKIIVHRYEYLSTRLYETELIRSGKQILSNDPEASLQDINSAILASLARKRGLKLTTKNTKNILAQLHLLELNYEKTQLRLNRRLYNALAASKKKLYFVSDMYLSQTDITELLYQFGAKKIPGNTSGDTGEGKYSGRAYVLLTKKYRLTPGTTLHIGDNKHSDQHMAQNAGFATFLLAPKIRKIRLKASKILLTSWVRLYCALHLRALKSTYRSTHTSALALERGGYNSTSIAQLFAPAIYHYLNSLYATAHTNGQKILFVSSESRAFALFSNVLKYKNHASAPYISRKTALLAYCYVARKKGIEYTELIEQICTIQRRKNPLAALKNLGLVSEHENSSFFHGDAVLSDILTHNNTKTMLLCKAQYSAIVKEFTRHTTRKDLSTVLIADVGWNNTIQILLQEVLRYAKFSNNLGGMYLATTGTNIFSTHLHPKSQGVIFNSLDKTGKYLYQPEVWESILSGDNIHSLEVQSTRKEIAKLVAQYSTQKYSSKDIYLASQKTLVTSLKNPPRKLIRYFANLRFDYGEGSMPVLLVDISKGWWYGYFVLLFQNKRFRDIYYNQAWKWGFANWYRMRILYRLYRRRVRKPSF